MVFINLIEFTKLTKVIKRSRKRVFEVMVSLYKLRLTQAEVVSDSGQGLPLVPLKDCERVHYFHGVHKCRQRLLSVHDSACLK